jgi:hypothetical protein
VSVRAVLIAALIASTGGLARADDKVPVWLGIQYSKQGTVGLPVGHVYEGSAAAMAGLQPGDEILELGGVRTPPGTELRPLIASMKAGDKVTLKVLHNGKLVTLEAVLLPRADGEIVQRRLVGKTLPPIAITRASDGAQIDLAALKGKVAILAVFPAKCDACASVVSALGPWAQAHDRDPVVVLGATPIGELAGLKAYLARNPIVVPVGAMPLPTDPREDSPFFADPEVDAVTFVVIDGKGVVKLASIVTPDATDQLDDVCVAAERALKQLRRR